MKVLNLLGRIPTLSQLRGCSIILHLCKRTIFAGLRYFSVSGIVQISGEHCLQVVWSKVVEGLNTPSFIILRISKLLLFISECTLPREHV